MVVTTMKQDVHRPGKEVEGASRSFMGSELALAYWFEADLRPGGGGGRGVCRGNGREGVWCAGTAKIMMIILYNSSLLLAKADIVSGFRH